MDPDRAPNDLAGTDLRIALLETSLSRQRSHVERLTRDGLDPGVAITVLRAGESVLKSLRAYRKLLSQMPTR